MEKLLILVLGIIIGMCGFWLWWKILEIKERENIAKIFDNMEKEMSEEKGAPVIIDEEVKELIELRAKADMFKGQSEDKN